MITTRGGGYEISIFHLSVPDKEYNYTSCLEFALEEEIRSVKCEPLRGAVVWWRWTAYAIGNINNGRDWNDIWERHLGPEVTGKF